ncbi:hypothetical protein Vadar_007676 [Vaccinium darrowii]|uniref:Uncharacterized protein n=1 Tax=Vaccinium darrowii TaxID=229202 RepID=A0ACB7X852_9ERIC|nr:hypothetical protein Vadar_007676 [Vaccinium darrowii]
MTYKSCNEECRKEAERPKKYSSPMLCIAIYIAVASLVCPVAMAGDVIQDGGVPEDDFNVDKLGWDLYNSVWLQQEQQEQYEAPMRWIGIYIAAASLFCFVAMTGDVFHGIRGKKLWFPCKFFTVNAASLTVLAVATKLPVDLTSSMDGKDSKVKPKLISTVFMITIMGNFLISFASLDSNAILVNVIALGILVITISVNVCIQIGTGAIGTDIRVEMRIVIVCMLFLFVTLTFSALTVPTIKRYLELKYGELHQTIFNGEKLREPGKLTNQELKEVVQKYWIMAETSSSQFVMARSVTSATCGIGIVVASKLVQLISIIITLPLFSCFYYRKKLKEKHILDSSASTDHENSKQGFSGPEWDLNDYVLLLEGEAKLPNRILKNMCLQMKKEIHKGQNQQPKNLKELLSKSRSNFKGVADFDSSQVSNCWTLPVVTLTTIAVALPTIENHRADRLISSVSEGLSYADLVEKSFSSKGDDVLKMKGAADVAWASIELYRKWLDKDLRKLPLKGISVEETLQTLLVMAEKAAIEFQKIVTGGPKVLAANSMYRISQTILKEYEGNKDAHTDGSLFEQLSIMIADILGACLSNLPRVIIQKCYCGAIEEREKSVKHAARLLGETEDILEILGHHQLPCLSGDRAAYIDEWRVVIMQKDTPSIVSPPKNETAASSSSELHIDVDE